jgi:hypothetical protein
MTVMAGFEAYSLGSWLDRGMSVQVKTVEVKRGASDRAASNVGTLIARIASTSALVVGAVVSNFSWAGTTQVPFSSIKTRDQGGEKDVGVQVPAGYVEKLMTRLATGPRIPDEDLLIPDPDSFF